MRRFLRIDALLALMALVLAATVVTGREMPALELIEQSAAQPAVRLALSLADRAGVPAQAGDPFAVRDFNPRPAPPPVVVVAPVVSQPPAAPQLPFRYVGRMVDGDTIVLLLARGEEILTVQPGQDLGAQWRLEQVSEHEIVFTYLPLKARRSLSI